MTAPEGLNERELRVLEAVVQAYIDTAEPAGSHAIARRSGLGVSLGHHSQHDERAGGEGLPVPPAHFGGPHPHGPRVPHLRRRPGAPRAAHDAGAGDAPAGAAAAPGDQRRRRDSAARGAGARGADPGARRGRGAGARCRRAGTARTGVGGVGSAAAGVQPPERRGAHDLRAGTEQPGAERRAAGEPDPERAARRPHAARDPDDAARCGSGTRRTAGGERDLLNIFLSQGEELFDLRDDPGARHARQRAPARRPAGVRRQQCPHARPARS